MLEVWVVFARRMDLPAVKLSIVWACWFHPVMLSKREMKHTDDFAVPIHFCTDVEWVSVMV
jgi:hypothetical protein